MQAPGHDAVTRLPSDPGGSVDHGGSTPAVGSAPTGKRGAMRRATYPETAIDNYTRVDSAIEFYLRVNALLRPDDTVVDLGAGRGAWFQDATSTTRRDLRLLKGKVATVIGLDVDPVVADNPTVDEAHTIEFTGPLPLPDSSVDLVVSDYTFEHVDDPRHTVGELDRVLRPGGWVCARTPNKWGYIGVMARLVPNQLHVRFLTRLQPDRKDVDVFPVRYRLNTPRELQKWFPPSAWEHVVYTGLGEPGYAGSSPLLWKLFRALLRHQPEALQPVLLIFLRKR